MSAVVIVAKQPYIHSSRQSLIPPVEANGRSSVSPAMRCPRSIERHAANSLHIDCASIGGEGNPIGPDELVGDDPHIAGVGVETVHLVLQQGWLAESLKEPISAAER